MDLASRNFKAGAHMIDSSAEQLADATRQTAEVILRVGEIRQSLTELLGRIRETSETLSETSSRLGCSTLKDSTVIPAPPCRLSGKKRQLSCDGEVRKRRMKG